MVPALFNTNILIDYLRGVPAAEIGFAEWDDKGISLITWIEIMIGVSDLPDEISAINKFLANFTLLQIDSCVAAEAVRVRKARKMKLPDAIILATANVSERIFVTRNIKDFPPSSAVRIPYGHPSSLTAKEWQLLSSQGMLPGGRAYSDD